jgi:hypothetical protein
MGERDDDVCSRFAGRRDERRGRDLDAAAVIPKGYSPIEK